MWLLIHASMAWAAPVGEPVPHVEQGTLTLRALGDLEETRIMDKDCGGVEPCTASWSSQVAGAEIQWTPVTGFGLAAELGYQSARVPEANFRGDGLEVALTLRGALPLTERWWMASQVRWSGSQLSSGSTQSNQESSVQGIGSVSILAAWTEAEQGPAIWGGVQSSLLWRQTVYPLGREDELQIPLRTIFPVSAVGGMSLRSDGLGLPWEDSARISVGLEARVGQSTGMGTWVGLSW